MLLARAEGLQKLTLKIKHQYLPTYAQLTGPQAKTLFSLSDPDK